MNPSRPAGRAAALARRTALLALAGCAALAGPYGCASTPDPSTHTAPGATAGQADEVDPDPWEGFNRPVFGFNDALDRWFFGPLATGWDFLTPTYFQVHLEQLFVNLEFPRRFLSSLTQAELRQSGIELGRFIVNSSVGIAGFWDPASHHLGLEGRNEDFEQTFGIWGMARGPYAMMPVLGPFHTRGLASFPFDYVTTGGNVLPGGFLLRNVNLRATNAEDFERARKTALDLYVFMRDAYGQRRALLLRNGAPAPDAPDDDFYDMDDDFYELDEDEDP